MIRGTDMDQNRMPLFEALCRYQHTNPVSFHVPGHKNGLLIEPLLKESASFLQYDATELSGLDDLHHAEGAIQEAQDLLADYYGSEKSYFLVNGSTVGNLAMILSVCRPGDRVLVDRNCHQSVLHALRLARANPVFVFPEIDEELQMPAGFSEKVFVQAFRQYRDVKACILTYPTYYGITCDLRAVAEIAHQNGAYVLVDEAHGAHFQVGSPFPETALHQGADAAVQSAHKMLPAMTMGSFLHIRAPHFPFERLKFYLSVLQSSSPSYPIMMSLDYARWYAANFSREDICYTLSQREQFSARLGKMLKLEEKEGQDPLKLLAAFPGLSGFKLQSVLEKAGVYTEMADLQRVVFVLPLLKNGMPFPYEDAAGRIEAALAGASPQAGNQPRLERAEQKPASGETAGLDALQGLTELHLAYDEMEEKEAEWVSFEEAKGRIAAKMVTPYPPGVPLLVPGEQVRDAHLYQIQQLRACGAGFHADAPFFENRLAVYR